MADMTTKLANLIDPEVMGDMVSARIPKKLRVAPFAKVDDTLAGVPGDTITVPAYAYIGDAADVAEGEEVTIEKMTTSTRKATVKKDMKGVILTDEAVLSGYGNPVGEANTQLAMAIAAKIDNDCMDALQTATLSYDGSAGAISYNGIVEALDLFEEEQGCDKVLFIHPKQLTALRKDADFLSADKYQAGLMLTGEVGMIAGCRIVPSKKVPLVEVGGTEGDEEGEPGTPGVECYAHRQAGRRPRDRGRGPGADHLPQAGGQCGDRAQTQDPHHRDHRRRVLCGGAVQRSQGGAGQVQGVTPKGGRLPCRTTPFIPTATWARTSPRRNSPGMPGGPGSSWGGCASSTP